MSTSTTTTRTARQSGLVGCTVCGRVYPMDTDHCTHCGAKLSSRSPRGLENVWALLIVGLMFYIPANIWPMLITQSLGRAQPSTIIGGVIELMHYGAWGIGLIVLTASVLIPIMKFLAIAMLALMVHFRYDGNSHRLLQLYEVVEYIGRWSMVDIFVVTILSALIDLGLIAQVTPGPAAGFFALSVIFTMLSARAFDPRLLWDRTGERI